MKLSACVLAALLQYTSAVFLRRTPQAALHVDIPGAVNETSQRHGSSAALLQGRGANSQLQASEEAASAMVLDLLNGKLSMSQAMRHIDDRMNLEDAMNRLQGKLPQEVAALVGGASHKAKSGQEPAPVAVYTTLKPDGTLYPIPKEAWNLNWTANITGINPAGWWSINFLTGSPADQYNNAFHFNPRPPSVVVRNAMFGGTWGGEERGGGYPAWKVGEPFEVRVYRGPSKFEIYIDGKRAEAFDFALRSTRIPTAIRIDGLNGARIDLLGFEVPGKLNEDSIQQARKILNNMIETSYQEMDDVTIECQAFKDANRKTFDQVVTDIARLGSETAQLDKVIGSALACTADQDVQFKSVKETLEKERNLFLKGKAENERLLRLKKNDLAVFDFILDATKCPDTSGPGPKFLQVNSTSDYNGVTSVCHTNDGGIELKFDDPKVETRILSMMTDDAKLALREALGLAMAPSHSSEPTDDGEDTFFQMPPVMPGGVSNMSSKQFLAAMQSKANMTFSPSVPWGCHKYEGGQAPTSDAACKTAGVIGAVEYKFVGSSGGCGSCWCCKRPRTCTVTVYEHDNFQGWAASYGEGAYPFSTFIGKGARNDQVSSIKVDGPCVGILFEHDLWQGWQAVFPEGTYGLKAMESRGARNDQTSSLIVYPEGYVAARKACESQYGQCLIGSCGTLTYFYDKNSPHCNCEKKPGQDEFIFRNMGQNKVGDDYGGAGDDIMGNQLFRRRKVLSGCQAGAWKLESGLVVTTTPPPAPTPAPVPVKASPKPAQRFKRCAPIKDDAGTCGLLHDTMSLQWGKYKDEVDVLEAEMHRAQDMWNKLSEDLMEQLRLVTGTKTVCQAKFSESTSSKNVLTEESKEKEIQRKTLTKSYDAQMKECKSRIEELLFTDVCAVRTVRNKLMEQSALTPPEDIVDCEVDDWVAGECTKPCDNSCPHMVGREVDPFKCGGTQKLVRNAIVANNAHGFRCPLLGRTMRCAQYKCSVDCKLSQWSGWSKCSKECEGGVQTQTRSIIQKPRFGGTACASTVDSRACNTMSCDRDCSLADWSKWGSCSMSCNPGGLPGMQERDRKVLVPIRGEGKCPKSTSAARYEKRACNEHACKGDEICVAKQDLLIAIDASGSLRESGFETVKAFALKLVAKYQSKYLGATAVRIGVILFGNGAKGGSGGSISPAINVVGLSEDLSMVAGKLKEIKWQKGFTNMAQAFVLADTMFTEKGRGGSAQSAVLMLSDGRYSFAFETDNAVKKLKEKNTMIYMAPVASQPGKWEEKVKSWASQPWQTNYQRVPGMGILAANMDFFVNELIARFCPMSISPSGQEGKDDAKGFMIIRKDGLPNLECAKFYDLGFVNRPADCMMKVVQEMGLKAFAISAKMQQGRKCFGEDLKFTKTNYTLWKSAKTDIPCPGGSWENNDLYDTYAIEPMTEDSHSGGNMTTG